MEGLLPIPQGTALSDMESDSGVATLGPSEDCAICAIAVCPTFVRRMRVTGMSSPTPRSSAYVAWCQLQAYRSIKCPPQFVFLFSTFLFWYFTKSIMIQLSCSKRQQDPKIESRPQQLK